MHFVDNAFARCYNKNRYSPYTVLSKNRSRIEGELMIKAELSYNPYIKETQVKFNGQPPRINSLVEKYQNQPLQDWVSTIPGIFHDEMNGYGFALEFCGTALDFDEVCHAFEQQGVTSDKVQIVLKTELECREVKIKKIRVLLNWLYANRYRKFDYDGFRAEHHELLDSDFICVVLHGDTAKPQLRDIAVERVDDVNELACTNLYHTPVLYCVSEETRHCLPKDLQILRQRKDILDEQRFFCIGGRLKPSHIRRLLNDLGITQPNIVTDINDDLVKKYFLIYPFSDYISDAIRLYRNEGERLRGIINADNVRSRMKGRQSYDQLAMIADTIRRIKEVDKRIQQCGKCEFPPEFSEIFKELTDKLLDWERKKTKITDLNAARIAASDFSTAAQKYFLECREKLKQKALERAQEIHESFRKWYLYADQNSKFMDPVNYLPVTKSFWIGEQTAELMALREEHYIDQKGSRIMQIFRTNEPNQPVLETAYYYQTWRDHMIQTIKPIMEKLVEAHFKSLSEYAERLSKIYYKQLQDFMKAQLEAKEKITANLSEDEKLLQADNEWLSSYMARLESIERS